MLLLYVYYKLKKNYSLQPILFIVNIDVSRHILVLDTSVFAKCNMGRREYRKTNAIFLSASIT
jgi:hypothetical protein